MDKFTIWGAIFLMTAIIVLPTVYLVFSFWWLLTGDMVTRLTFFTTGLIFNTLLFLVMVIMSTTPKFKEYLDKSYVKKLFKR
jgi:hypothetical protein